MEDIFITLERNGTSWGRKLNVPTEYSIAGVEHDKNARCFRFKLPKLPEFQDLVDLSGLSCRVNYQHEFFDYAFTTDLFLETNETITDESGEEYLIFRWVLGEECFPTSGKLSFILCCSFRGEQDDILKEWNSEIATVEVRKGLELDNEIVFQKDISANGWATTRRIADGAVTLDKLAQEVKDEFLDLDTKIANETTKAENDNKDLETKLNKKIEDNIQEVFDGKVVSAEKFSGKCTKSGIEVMHITGKTEQERTNGYQLFDISKCVTQESKSVKVVVHDDGSYSTFPSNTTSAEGWVAGGPFNITEAEVKQRFHAGPIQFVQGHKDLDVIPICNFRTGDVMDIFVNPSNGTHSLTQNDVDTKNAVFGLYFRPEKTTKVRNFKPMLYQDGDGTWEPFTGGKPGPNPDYPLPLKSFSADKLICMGKNVAVVSDGAYRNDCTANMLADGTLVFKSTGTRPYVGNIGAYDSYGKGEPASSDTNTLIPVPAGATRVYTKSFDGVINKIIIHMFDKWRHSLGYLWEAANASTILLKEDTAYISVSFQMISYTGATAGQTYTDRVMASFEPITEWVPPHYEEITLPEPLILRSSAYGDYDEYMGDGMVLRRCKEVTYDGTQAWLYNASPRRFFTYMDGAKILETNHHVLCDSGISIEYPKSMGDDPEPGTCTQNGISFYWTPPRNIASETALYAYLAEHPIKVIYPLAVPVIETYPMPILPSWDDDMRAFFVSDTETDIIWRPCPVSDDKLRIQELNAELTSLKKTVDDILNHRTDVLVEEV